MITRCLLLVLVASLVGCGSSEFVPVTGVVTLDGKPVEGASVIFHRLDGDGESSVAATNAEGRFSLTTEEKPGAWIGSYEVAVRKVRTEGFPQIAEPVEVGKVLAEGEGALSGLVSETTNITEIWSVPKKYGTFETSKLKFDVTPAMEPVKLELISEP